MMHEKADRSGRVRIIQICTSINREELKKLLGNFNRSNIDRTSIRHQSNQVETFGLKFEHFQLVEDMVQSVKQCKV